MGGVARGVFRAFRMGRVGRPGRWANSDTLNLCTPSCHTSQPSADTDVAVPIQDECTGRESARSKEGELVTDVHIIDQWGMSRI